MIKKEYITPEVKVMEIQQNLMAALSATGLEGFDGNGGESTEDDEAD